MTFSEFVLEARMRLHDYRSSDMQIITDVNKDGIRWTSEQLQSLCRGALQEMLRTFRALKLDNYIHDEVQHQFIPCSIEAGSGVVRGLPSRYQKVERIQSSDLGIIYDYVKATTFLSKKWRTLKTDTLTVPTDGCTHRQLGTLDEAWFTVVWDKERVKPLIYTLPRPADNIENCEAVVTYPLTELFTVSGTFATTPLPFIDIDDIMLDYVEKQARQIDHNEQQVALITKTIESKLQELTIELQRCN